MGSRAGALARLCCSNSTSEPPLVRLPAEALARLASGPNGTALDEPTLCCPSAVRVAECRCAPESRGRPTLRAPRPLRRVCDPTTDGKTRWRKTVGACSASCSHSHTTRSSCRCSSACWRESCACTCA
eukprot:scaffold92130_cov69-Phaeocystis_antarctica.AAC.1